MPELMTGLLAGSALLGAGSSLFGAHKQSEAADKATKAQTAANDKALALQKEIFETQREDMMPWLDAGREALGQLQTKINDGSFDLSGFGYDDLIADPSYQFRLQQGQNALNASAAARGRLVSGAQLQAANDYAQDMASTEFGNAFARRAAERDAEYSRLAGLAGVGQSAAGNVSNYAAQYGNNASNVLMNTGHAQGQNAINQGNIWASLGNNLAGVGQRAIGNYLTSRELGYV
jgi:hypothetical protein